MDLGEGVEVSPPQCMTASPAAASAAAGPTPHAHPAASKRPCNQTPHMHAARCVGGPAAALWPASHAGRWDTLEGPCCLTCRRRSVKHRLRERKAVPQRQAVPIVAPSTRAPQASATALLLGKLEPLYPPFSFPTAPPASPGSDPGVRGPPQRPSVPALVDPRDSSRDLPRPIDPPPSDRGSPASDPGAAARDEAKPRNRSAASQLATAATRSLQPQSCPLSERH